MDDDDDDDDERQRTQHILTQVSDVKSRREEKCLQTTNNETPQSQQLHKALFICVCRHRSTSRDAEREKNTENSIYWRNTGVNSSSSRCKLETRRSMLALAFLT